MARRMRKAEATLLMWVVIIGVPIWGITQLGESVGWTWLGGGVVAAIVLYYVIKAQNVAATRRRLMGKYRDPELVEKLMGGYFWEGQSAEQLIDSLGRPEDIDEKVLKTKKKQVWKYGHEGGNRYRLRITLDNDVVIGWERRA